MNHEHFMEMALSEAAAALYSGEFPVGCIIEYKGNVLVTGSRTGTKGDSPNEVDHAEMIALKRLSGLNIQIEKKRATLFSTLEPCLMCFGAIILSGIGNIVYAYEDVMGGGTSCDLTNLPPLYSDRPVSIVPHILRSKSITLLKTYFENPENSYWNGSLLQRYTLSR